MPSSRAWQSYYKALERWAPAPEHEQHFYARLLRRSFRPGMSWLDAGCGRSLIPRWLKDAGELEQQFSSGAALLVGCDVDLEALKTPSCVKRIGSNLEELAFRDNSFDLITCNMVVEHLERPVSVFREFFRVLKPAGTVLVLTPNLYHWTTVISAITPYRFHRLLLKTFWGRDENDVFLTKYRCNTSRALSQTLRSAGFSWVTVCTVVGRPRMIGFGPVLYLECLFQQVIRRFPLLHEVLCAIASKSASEGETPAGCFEERERTYSAAVGGLA